jgi:glycosyltransferase involved in cell wall biosynthesis
MDGREQPLVSIIAISYNHASYIQEALESIFLQTYKNIEVIIVDDFSSDTSSDIIKHLIRDKNIRFIQNQQNSGNCKSFNAAYRLSKGKYIIDFALDDMMYPDRVVRQVALFETLPANVGVVFTNVNMIDEKSKVLYTQYPKHHHLLHTQQIPVGNVFEAVLSRYYINPVSMMFRREVVEELNGYDESLSYEDFDFWIRSSRVFEYRYLLEVLSAKRIVKTSLSSLFYKKDQTVMFESTLKVCKKAWWLCSNRSEIKALVHRCRYEAQQAYRYSYVSIVEEYLKILKEIDPAYYLYNPFVRIFLCVKSIKKSR